MRGYIFVVLLVFAGFTGFSQSKKALSFIKKGSAAFDEKDYAKADEYLTKALQYDDQTPDVYFKLGKIAVLNRDEATAVANYTQVLSLAGSDKAYKDAHVYLGLRHMRAGNYAEARGLLEFAVRNTPASAMLHHELLERIEEAKMGAAASENALNISPTVLPEIINFKGKQYFPVFTADNETLFFTAVEDDGDENIYSATVKNGQFSKPTLVNGEINSTANEGTCSVSSDGRTMVFTSCEGRSSFGSCDLYISFKNGGQWSTPQNLGQQVNSPYWESQPALSSDGKLLFFSSERPGGYGRKDIWVSQFNGDAGWSLAQNLGGKINSVKDDISPFLHANGSTLFYSSDGRKSFGGFDIYMSNLNNGLFEVPENLGYPINNADDQVSLFVTADGKKAYYATDNKSRIDLFSFDVPKEIESKYRKVNYLKGVITDAATNAPIQAIVQLIDLKTQTVVLTTISDAATGEYLAVLPHGKNYGVHVNREGYLFKSLTFDISENQAANNTPLNIQLAPIVKEADIVLTNIFFDSGSADLREESFFELTKLAELLASNPAVKAEIKGHTDDVGNAVDNLSLSKKRAEAVLDFLLTRNISGERLVARGFGETQPLLPNDTEENRQQNRRIEFRIL